MPFPAVVNVPGGLPARVAPKHSPSKRLLGGAAEGEGRPLLLFYVGGCFLQHQPLEELLRTLSSGKNLRTRMVQALKGTSPDIQVRRPAAVW